MLDFLLGARVRVRVRVLVQGLTSLDDFLAFFYKTNP